MITQNLDEVLQLTDGSIDKLLNFQCVLQNECVAISYEGLCNQKFIADDSKNNKRLRKVWGEFPQIQGTNKIEDQ